MRYLVAAALLLATPALAESSFDCSPRQYEVSTACALSDTCPFGRHEGAGECADSPGSCNAGFTMPRTAFAAAGQIYSAVTPGRSEGDFTWSPRRISIRQLPDVQQQLPPGWGRPPALTYSYEERLVVRNRQTREQTDYRFAGFCSVRDPNLIN